MSQTPMTSNQNIPTRNIVINHPSEMPDNLSSTPGGTLYSTTPGGTRLVYDRSFMMNLANSPLSHSAPNNIPQCLIRGQPNIPIKKCLAGSPPKVSQSPPNNYRNFRRYSKNNNKYNNNNNRNGHNNSLRRKSEEEIQFEMENIS